MKQSQRLRQISKVAQQKEQENGRQLAQSRAQSEQQEQQLMQLRQYRDEYKQRFQQLGEQGANVRQLADFRSFLAKLNDAIAQQEQAVANCQQTMENHHNLWLEASQRVKALDKAVAKRHASELHEENKKEQIQSDERSIWTKKPDT